MNPPVLSDIERQSIIDGEHLKLLRIFHFILGGMRILFSSIFIIHTVMFLVMGSGAIPLDNGKPGAPPAWLFTLLACVFGFVVLLGWTSGILTLISGQRLGRRRGRVFSMAVAAINCISMPYGTALGVLTLLCLNRPSVKAEYDRTAQTGKPSTA